MSTMEQSENPLKVEDEPEHIGFRDGYLFIVDLSPEMFTKESDEAESYFEQCLQTYGRILSQKLSWNRRDWMGLIFFGTKEWDMDPETKNILTVEKFGEVATSMLSNVMHILNNRMDEYKEMSTQSEYPLHDVLWHAARSFDSAKVSMTRRQVILITCRDNPFSDDEPERHRIRLRAKTFGDRNVNLRIVGLGEDWNHENFYRDIEMLANNIESDDVRRVLLEDLEVQIRFEARTTSHLKFRIGDGLHIGTVISPFSGQTKFLKEVKMSQSTNEILDVVRHYGRPQSFDDESDDEESQELVATQAPDNTRKAIKRGDELISFGQKEVRKIRLPGSAGIDLLGFKPISFDFRYHISPAKFVNVEISASDEEKELFTALLYQCEAKEVMAVCAVYDRGGPYLAKMIPNTRLGGFYLYKIAFFEQLNNLGEYIDMCIDGGEEENDEPVDEASIDLMKKVIKKLRINWDPSMFRNPKLHAQLAYIEALALDTLAETVEDTTLPPADIIARKLSGLVTDFTEMFGSTKEESTKRKSAPKPRNTAADKDPKFDDFMMQGLIDSGRLKDVTVPVLKAMARSLGAPTGGNKAELVKRVTESFAAKNAN